MVIVRHISF